MEESVLVGYPLNAHTLLGPSEGNTHAGKVAAKNLFSFRNLDVPHSVSVIRCTQSFMSVN